MEGKRTTETKERPIAKKTLLDASSECNVTLGGGKSGMSADAGSLDVTGALAFVMGTGLMRLGTSEDWRRRTEGFITEFERILVP